MELVEEVYRVTERLLQEERFGLTAQMRRAAVSIPSNIAEGFRRAHQKEYYQFLSVAYGSGAELETQVEICRRLWKDIDVRRLQNLLDEVMKMLHVMLSRLR